MFLVRLLSAVIITFLQPGSAHATVQLLVQQLNGDVVVTGSGSANTTALNLDGTDTDYANVLTDSHDVAPFLIERRGLYTGTTAAVVRPGGRGRRRGAVGAHDGGRREHATAGGRR